MLLEFKMKNFKSFKEEADFKMTPAQKITGLEYSLIKREHGTALSSAVIYGPNSSGKTNIIGAMEVFRSIILTGNINNRDDITSPNPAVYRLELIPNIESINEPVSFSIKFLVEELLVEMKLVLDLGNFVQKNYDRKILEEELKINNKLIYHRKDKLEIGRIEAINQYKIVDFDQEVAEKIAKNNLDARELVFNGIFKTLYSKKIYDIIYTWFRDKFKIVYRSDCLHFSPRVGSVQEDKKFFSDKMINEAAKEFGMTSEKIAYPIVEKNKRVEPISVITVNGTEKKAVIPAELFESFGTIRFLNIFPMIYTAIKKGTALVMDELDASIHPMAIMNIISMFHNDEINKKGAQLIFNTHNPIFLNNALLRRDEIKFVEKEGNSSTHYALSDFGTNGKNGVRKTEDYMKNYFINKYGAIKDIDFSELLKEN